MYFAEYFKKGIKIAQFDERTIKEISADRKALWAGLLFLIFGGFCSLWGSLILGPKHKPLELLIFFVLSPLFAVLLALVQCLIIGIGHLAAKFLLGGYGSYLQVLRVLSVGAIVLWITIIPIIGLLIASLWWGLAIYMVTFEELHGIRKTQAAFIVLVLAVGNFLLRMTFKF